MSTNTTTTLNQSVDSSRSAVNVTGTNPMLDGLEMLFLDDEEDGKDGAEK
jgi:hypothetical protein